MVPWRLGVKRGRRGSRKAAYFRQLTKTLMLLLINVGHQLTIIGIQNVLLTTTTDQLNWPTDHYWAAIERLCWPLQHHVQHFIVFHHCWTRTKLIISCLLIFYYYLTSFSVLFYFNYDFKAVGLDPCWPLAVKVTLLYVVVSFGNRMLLQSVIIDNTLLKQIVHTFNIYKIH